MQCGMHITRLGPSGSYPGMVLDNLLLNVPETERGGSTVYICKVLPGIC